MFVSRRWEEEGRVCWLGLAGLQAELPQEDVQVVAQAS